jgi:periplasmic protein CpxP/Spy
MKQSSRIHKLAAALMMIFALTLTAVYAQSTDSDTPEQGKSGRFHGQGFRHHGHGRHGGHGMLFEKLNLSDAQKDQLKQLRSSQHEAIKPLMEQIRSKQAEIRQSTQGNTFNEALVTQKLTEIAGLKAKLMGERFKMHQDMLNLLTPEQKTKLEQMQQEFKQKREEFKQKKQEFRQKRRGGQTS